MKRVVSILIFLIALPAITQAQSHDDKFQKTKRKIDSLLKVTYEKKDGKVLKEKQQDATLLEAHACKSSVKTLSGRERLKEAERKKLLQAKKRRLEEEEKELR